MGAEWLRREAKVADEEVLEAVRAHTSGAQGMGKIAAVVFLADKLDPSKARRYPFQDGVHAEARRDLGRALLRFLDSRLAGFLEDGSVIDPSSVALRNELLVSRQGVPGGMRMIVMYTDGSCLRNPGGPGGWAAVIVEEDDSERVVVGGEESTTNNRMEMLAVIKGLEAVPEGAEVLVHSDSQYVVNTMTRNWRRNVNRDLWSRLDAQIRGRTVRWRWVRGHAGNPMNEKVDSLANEQAHLYAGGGGRRGSDRPQPPTREESSLSHVDETGRARMVDVGAKAETQRVAVARGSVFMKPETLRLIESNGFKKGDVLGVARIAGVMGAKSASQLIPLCHPLPLDQVTVDFRLDRDDSAAVITATAKTTAKTGVEMEALTAVSVAALTLYDMCKAVDRGMRIEGVQLVSKSGGSGGDYALEE